MLESLILRLLEDGAIDLHIEACEFGVGVSVTAQHGTFDACHVDCSEAIRLALVAAEQRAS